ncbi:MAG TPA: glycoside hydrolase family 13 protein [Anaerolineales bacterium]|nr:glycoside hydrolase family 13 protein [Anaerolineales bacterium]
MEVQTPDWVKDAIFYQIFPDRFAYSDRFTKPANLEPWDAPPSVFGIKGGDLYGIVEKMDYLSDLGITALYLNPIFQSASSHRYHTHDYFKIDPILGGEAAFDALLSEAHQRGIRIVLDGVFNHASRGFFQFNSILELGEHSPYTDWFTVNKYPLNAYSEDIGYEAWVGLPALPKFNLANPQVRQFIFDVARYWLERGIDGWRLDVPYEIKDDAFWQEFRRVVKAANPEAYIVGEVAWEAQRWLQGDQFDAVMNYQFTQACLGFFAGPRIDRSMELGLMGLPATPVLDAPAFARRAQELLHLYPQPVVEVQLNLLDSHDMPRFISLAGGDLDSLRLATLFQMTYPGAPCIYYGDEIGLSGGGRNPEPARGHFPWNPELWNQDLLNDFKQLIAIRRAHPALRAAEFRVLHAADQVIVYLRRNRDEMLVVLINNGDQPHALDFVLPVDQAWPSHWTDLISGAALHQNAGLFEGLVLPARSGYILQPQKENS